MLEVIYIAIAAITAGPANVFADQVPLLAVFRDSPTTNAAGAWNL